MHKKSSVFSLFTVAIFFFLSFYVYLSIFPPAYIFLFWHKSPIFVEMSVKPLSTSPYSEWTRNYPRSSGYAIPYVVTIFYTNYYSLLKYCRCRLPCVFQYFKPIIFGSKGGSKFILFYKFWYYFKICDSITRMI